MPRVEPIGLAARHAELQHRGRNPREQPSCTAPPAVLGDPRPFLIAVPVEQEQRMIARALEAGIAGVLRFFPSAGIGQQGAAHLRPTECFIPFTRGSSPRITRDRRTEGSKLELAVELNSTGLFASVPIRCPCQHGRTPLNHGGSEHASCHHDRSIGGIRVFMTFVAHRARGSRITRSQEPISREWVFCRTA